jgi:hypothetical protein
MSGVIGNGLLNLNRQTIANVISRAAVTDPRIDRITRSRNRHIGVHLRSSAAKKSFCLPIIRRVFD